MGAGHSTQNSGAQKSSQPRTEMGLKVDSGRVAQAAAAWARRWSTGAFRSHGTGKSAQPAAMLMPAESLL